MQVSVCCEPFQLPSCMHGSPPRDGTSNDMYIKSSDWHNNHSNSFSFFEIVFFLDPFQKQYDARKLIECILMHGRRICGALVQYGCYQHVKSIRSIQVLFFYSSLCNFCAW